VGKEFLYVLYRIFDDNEELSVCIPHNVSEKCFYGFFSESAGQTCVISMNFCLQLLSLPLFWHRLKMNQTAGERAGRANRRAAFIIHVWPQCVRRIGRFRQKEAVGYGLYEYIHSGSSHYMFRGDRFVPEFRK
jgi:hypothetical protein